MKYFSTAYVALGLTCIVANAATAQGLAGAPTSDTPVYAVGSLAPLGSFEFELAPLYTRLAVIRHQAAVALRKQSITVDQAQAVQDQADAVRKLLDASLVACGENAHGRCVRHPKTAKSLKASAARALAAIK